MHSLGNKHIQKRSLGNKYADGFSLGIKHYSTVPIMRMVETKPITFDSNNTPNIPNGRYLGPLGLNGKNASHKGYSKLEKRV